MRGNACTFLHWITPENKMHVPDKEQNNGKVIDTGEEGLTFFSVSRDFWQLSGEVCNWIHFLKKKKKKSPLLCKNYKPMSHTDLKWTTETQIYKATQYTGSYNPWDFFHVRSTTSEVILWLWSIRICGKETNLWTEANCSQKKIKKERFCPYSKPLTWLPSISTLKSSFCFPLLK